MPRNIDILQNMNSTELADFLAIERERMASSVLSSMGVEMPDTIKVAVRIVLKDWLEREVDG